MSSFAAKRKDERKTPADPSSAGARKHARGGSRRALLPSIPALVGTVAVTLASVGAVAFGGGAANAASAERSDLVLASAHFGASDSASSGDVRLREQRLSRDSAREAQADAADAELKEAAEAQAEERDAALRNLAASAEKHAADLAANAWVLPVTGYRLTGRFGQCSSLWSSCHTGLDFAAPYGTTIVSVAAGTVTEVGYDGAYGNKTVVTLEDGTEVWYCHQASFGVSVGDSVAAGQAIGTVGSTGNSTGNHLHLEIRPGAGDPVDPGAALAVNGVTP